MEKSFVRQTRSKTKAARIANPTGVLPSTTGQAPDSADDEFVPSLIDSEHGQDHDCAVCDRPNNAEWYMVQCGGCKRWYHFSCARVDTKTVHSKEFVCVECSRKQISQRSVQSVSGRSSAASSRRSQYERELQRLEDERRAEEQVEEERRRQEKLLMEKAAKEKLEREKQFIAKKHELLRLQDDEIVSTSSRRSKRSSIQRVEDWVDKLVDPAAAPGDQEQVPGPVDQHSMPVGASTPLGRSVEELQRDLAGDDNVEQGLACVVKQRTSVPRTIGSITIGDSPEVELPKLALVDIQPYVRLLDESVPTSSNIGPPQSKTGTNPKIIAKVTNPSPFELWHRETCNRRQQREDDVIKENENRLHEIEAALQRQRDLELKYQQETELRRRREVDLVNRLNRLEDQRAEERQQLKEVESALKRQLEESLLRYQVLEMKRRQEQSAREDQLRQYQERERLLTEQLKSVQVGEARREEAFQNPEGADGQSRGIAAFQLQQAAVDQWQSASPFQLHQPTPFLPHGAAACPQQDAPVSQLQQGVPDVPVPMRPVSNPLAAMVSDPVCNLRETDTRQVARSVSGTLCVDAPGRIGTPHTFTIDQELGQSNVGQQGQSQFHPFNPPEINMLGGNHFPQVQFGPTSQQLMARQVIPKELPVFSGDPTEWPLFVS